MRVQPPELVRPQPSSFFLFTTMRPTATAPNPASGTPITNSSAGLIPAAITQTTIPMNPRAQSERTTIATGPYQVQ